MKKTSRIDLHRQASRTISQPSIKRMIGELKYRHDNFLTVAACALLLMGQSLPAAATSWQSIDSISKAASDLIVRDRGEPTSNQSIHVSKPDKRLRLHACSQPLDAQWLNPGQRGNRMAIKVFCDGARPWKVYLQARIASFSQVLVAARHLPRGHIIEKSDLTLVRRDVSNRPSGYLSDPTAVAGQTLRQSVTAGSELLPSQIRQAVAIKRGQIVGLVSEAQGIAIRMNGSALNDGSVGGRIAVRNLSSGKIVEGVVQADHSILVGAIRSPR